MFRNIHICLLAAIIAFSIIAPSLAATVSAEPARTYWAKYSVYAEIEAAQKNVIRGTLYTNITFNGSSVEMTQCFEQITVNDQEIEVNACSTYSYGAEKPGDATGWFLKSLVGNINSFASINNGSIEAEVGYGFQGSDSYKGYPVLKYNFSVRLVMSIALPINASPTQNVSLDMKGELYVHSGVPVIVYISMNTSIAAGGFNAKYSYVAEIENSNLPATAPSKIIELPHTTIIVGGEPDAAIHIRGSRGDTRIYVNNTGDGYGYVTVIGKAARLDTGGEAKKDYVLPPKTSIVVEVEEPLDRDIDESVEAAALPSYVYYIAILAVSVLTLLLALLVLIRKRP